MIFIRLQNQNRVLQRRIANSKVKWIENRIQNNWNNRNISSNIIASNKQKVRTIYNQKLNSNSKWWKIRNCIWLWKISVYWKLRRPQKSRWMVIYALIKRLTRKPKIKFEIKNRRVWFKCLIIEIVRLKIEAYTARYCERHYSCFVAARRFFFVADKYFV